MKMEHRIEDGVTAEAQYIVPISENPVNRAVFNAIVEDEFGRDLQSAEEVEEAWELMMDRNAEIERALESVGGIDPLDEDDIQRVYEVVLDELQ